MDVVGIVIAVLIWAWLAVCLVGVLGVVLGLAAHYIGLVEEWLRPAMARRAEARRSS